MNRIKAAILYWVAGLLAGGTMLAASLTEKETALRLQGGEQPKIGKAPLKLVVGVNDIYCKDSSCKCIEHIATRQYAEFLRALKERYNIELQFVYMIEPYDLDKAFVAGKYDAVLTKPWLVFHRPEGRSTQMVRVADLQDFERNTSLWGVVIVPKNSPIKKMADISGRRVAYGQTDAYEKHQGALALFQREGLKIAADKWIERASCLECLDLLMKGEADVAVISNYALTADCAVDVTTPEAWRVIGQTEKIPLTSFMVDLKRVTRDDAWRLQRALIELSTQSLPKSMCGGGFVEAVSWKIPRATP